MNFGLVIYILNFDLSGWNWYFLYFLRIGIEQVTKLNHTVLEMIEALEIISNKIM